MTQQLADLQQAQHQLAEKFSVVVDCPACEYAVPWKGCPTCEDTPGKVTTWPLRVECPGGKRSLVGCQGSSCGMCHGDGWTACTDMATLMRELEKAGARPCLWLRQDEEVRGWFCWLRLPSGRYTDEIADDPEVALVQAALQWVEAKNG